jgi:4-hydroxyphenylpyruvate dioxygenase
VAPSRRGNPATRATTSATIRRAAVKTYGDTVHSLISYKGYRGPFLPGYREQKIAARDAGILRVDHMVGNVELGKMNQWADYYSQGIRLPPLHQL